MASALVETRPTSRRCRPTRRTSRLERDRLWRGFARLSVEHRAVVVLHHYLGQTQGQVADTLDIPVETVRSRLRHAMRGLRAAIEADERVVPGHMATPEASR